MNIGKWQPLKSLPFAVIVPSLLTFSLFAVVFFTIVLPSYKSFLYESRKESLKMLVETAESICSHFRSLEAAGNVSRAEAQARAVTVLRSVRYGEIQKDYFWVNTLAHDMVMHPYRPELEGTSLASFRDSNGKLVFVELSKIASRYGSGFSDYFWQWKDDPSRIEPKLSFVKLFKPWGWVIGSGIYVRDVQREIDQLTATVTRAAIAILAIVTLLLSIIVYVGILNKKQQWLAEEKNVQLLNQLHQSQKMDALGTLAGGVAHDFNNKLAVIRGHAELALDEIPESSDAHNDLEKILTAAKRSKELVSQILDFSRQKESTRSEIDGTKTVRDAADLLRASLPSSITLNLNIPKSALWIHGNVTQLQQVVINLGSNAAYAMQDERGELTITATHERINTEKITATGAILEGEYFCIRVKDNGKGIPKEALLRIFDPFFTTKPPSEGTGLGLAVVHGIVRSHGGGIEVESELELGTLIAVYIPTAKACEEELSPKDGFVPGGQERILFVDDEPDLVEIARRGLGPLGYHIETSSNGLDAYRNFKEASPPFDLVITDETMPQLTGIRLAEQLSELSPEMPIILCTGHPDRLDPLVLSEIGIKKILTKPYTRLELVETIRRVMDRADR